MPNNLQDKLVAAMCVQVCAIFDITLSVTVVSACLVCARREANGSQLDFNVWVGFLSKGEGWMQHK